MIDAEKRKRRRGKKKKKKIPILFFPEFRQNEKSIDRNSTNLPTYQPKKKKKKRFYVACESHPKVEILGYLPLKIFGLAVGIFGLVLVLSSYYRLKITGTYLGDYFGILMEERITSFPFNVMNDPMYMGACMIHLGRSIW